jgi:hypothetical protein
VSEGTLAEQREARASGGACCWASRSFQLRGLQVLVALGCRYDKALQQMPLDLPEHPQLRKEDGLAAVVNGSGGSEDAPAPGASQATPVNSSESPASWCLHTRESQRNPCRSSSAGPCPDRRYARRFPSTSAVITLPVIAVGLTLTLSGRGEHREPRPAEACCSARQPH